MKTSFSMKTAVASMLAAALAVGAGVAVAGNPVDKVTNLDALSYDDVQMKRPDFAEPFQRDGDVYEPQRLGAIVPGTSVEELRAALGEPVERRNGKKGEEWDYHIKFQMPDSANYLVCQYKVVLNAERNAVAQTVWRRRQCRDIVRGAH